jgi:hypothetical protein
MPGAMFAVSEQDAAAVRAAFERGGEFAAAVELRRLFPDITDNAPARAHARTIAGWKPLALPRRPPAPLRQPPRDKSPPDDAACGTKRGSALGWRRARRVVAMNEG